jgi:thiamine kinase-like enzyme
VSADLVSVRAAVAEIPILAGPWTIEPLRGLTNRSYRFSRPGEALVLRLPGPQSGDMVDRDHEAHNHALAASLGLAPPLLHSDPRGLLVTRYVEGAAPLGAHAARDPAVVAAVGKLLARLHRSEVRFRGSRDPFENFDSYMSLAGDRADPDFRRLRKAAEPVRIALTVAATEPAPSHIDPAPANILLADAAMLLIDWEYSAMAAPSWDIAGFATEADLDPDATALLLEGYGLAPTKREQARIALWRLALDLLAGAWAQLRTTSERSVDLERLRDERKARAAAALGNDLGGLLRDLAG